MRARVPALVATALGLVPALVWAGTQGAAALSLRGLGMMAGLAGAGLFAVSLLLMLRLAVLDRLFYGLGHVQRVHHLLGTAAFLAALLHPLALALAVLLAREGERRAALRLLWPDPSSGVVFAGWASLLLFVVFFVVTVAPRVPYRAWRAVHRASGLAVAAMVWHLAAAGDGSVSSVVVLALVLVGVLGYLHRLLVEDPPRRGLRYRIAAVSHRGRDVVDLELEPIGPPGGRGGPAGQALRFDPGQFVYLALRDSPAYRACGELHPYTLTGRPDDPRLHLSIKALGDCTRHVQEVSPGVEAIIQGPFGGLFPASSRSRPQVWIAGGIGITPFLGRAARVEDTAASPSIHVVYAAHDASAALYLDDLLTLASGRGNMRVHTIFEDKDGLPTAAAIEARVGTLEGRDFMIAGPSPMIATLRKELRARGVPAAHIHTEQVLPR